ncbi:hypothetical protein TNCV_468751 [Trichonephila clavipes]|nr:hypothetical protein TNCV_468751 [Trichonephila clavipes]
MEAIASEAASGTSSAREGARRLAYHHHLSTIFFVESSSCTHTNCNRAMNFCLLIPHRGKHLRSGPSLKWNRISPGFLTSCGQMKRFSRFMVTLTTITVAFGRPLIPVPMVSSVSRFNTGKLLVVGIFEISRLSIRSLKSVGTERCDPLRSILHTSGHVALVWNVFWICHSSGMSSPLLWWSCGTYSGVIKL